MIAGGSGITPIFNVASEIVKDKEDKTEIVILSLNRSEEDILMRKELEEMGGRVKVYYGIDVGHEGWKGFVGYVRKEMLEAITKMDEPDTFYCFSGPGPMNQTVKKLFE